MTNLLPLPMKAHHKVKQETPQHHAVPPDTHYAILTYLLNIPSLPGYIGPCRQHLFHTIYPTFTSPSSTSSSLHFQFIQLPCQSIILHSFNMTKPFQNTLIHSLTYISLFLHLRLISSFLALSILLTPQIFLKQFISTASICFLSCTFNPQTSDPYNRLGSTIPSYIPTFASLETSFLPQLLQPSRHLLCFTRDSLFHLSFHHS